MTPEWLRSVGGFALGMFEAATAPARDALDVMLCPFTFGSGCMNYLNEKAAATSAALKDLFFDYVATAASANRVIRGERSFGDHYDEALSPAVRKYTYGPMVDTYNSGDPYGGGKQFGRFWYAATLTAATGGAALAGRASTSASGGLTAGAARSAGYSGALRSTATGRFVVNPATAKKPVTSSSHGNSLSSPITASLYMRYSPTGVFQKFGITGNLKNRYSKNALGADSIVEIGSGARWAIANIERTLVERYGGPMNLEAWARSKRE